MTNYISYSLYGSDPYYVNGALNNLVNNSKIMPGWVSVLYVSKFTYENFHLLLSRFRDNLIVVAGHDNNISSIWRFFATDLGDAEHILFRDCDSLITLREKAYIDEWVSSNKALHIIRDHPLHESNIMAGLCGVKKYKVKNLWETFNNYKFIDVYGIDQWFINRELFKKYRRDTLVHDSINIFKITSLTDMIAYEKSEYIGKRLPKIESDQDYSDSIFEYYSIYKNNQTNARFKKVVRNVKIDLYIKYRIFMTGAKVDIELIRQFS